jgi:translocation and assembly module TamB
LNGLIELSRKRQLDLTMAGDFDLALLNEFVKKVGATGNGKLNARIRGTLNDPRIQGDAILEGRQFSYEEFPNSLSQFTAKLFFDENQIKIDSLTGSSGGGKVQVNGDIIFSQETINLVNLKIEAREVRFRYPEGMRSVVDADLTLRGSQRSQLLAGNVRILSASFLKDYDPITEFLENHNTKITLPGSKDLGESLSLDLSITGDRNIKLDTTVFKITSRADLKVRGTATDPLITGSIDASAGELFFQGARYHITRGRIDFINPVRFDPHIDLEAEADVRDYRIVLTINGTADKLHADLRSDPPLPTVDLFSLVSTGGTDVSGASSTAYLRPFPTTGRQQDSSVAAASLLSEGLSLKVGSRVKRIFGLDRFRVDPFLVGAERDPTARVTFGQQITKDLSITYSTSVSSNEQQVIILEYDINNSTSIIASRDDEGALGLDIRFRKRLRQKNR